jgi:ribonuclease E
MPSHVKRVKDYVDPVPLFQRFGAEDQLSAMYQPLVQLKSGGYVVINPTEALVSIDINSGRSTREHNIEQTAFSTNIEAAHEIARQLRLRDMAGLVVIDFIDMESSGHIRKVEKAMKDALKNDRARIQVGRISSFGLMEMSRQRLRTGVLEASTRPCVHCEGTGLMRTASSAGLSALRMLEDEAGRGRGSRLVLRAGREAAVYLLNKKRAEIAEVEGRYGVLIEVLIDDSLEGARMSVESHGPPPAERPRLAERAPVIEEEEDFLEEEIEDEEEEEEEAEEPRREARRDRGRSGRGREERDEGGEGEAGRKRRRRRGRRGGRRREHEGGEGEGEGEVRADDAAPESEAGTVEAPASDPVSAPAEEGAEPARKTRRRPRARKRDEGETVEAPAEAEAAPEPAPVAEAEAPKPKRGRRKKAEPEAALPVEAFVETPVAEEAPVPEAANDAAPPKRRRTKKAVAAETGAEADAAAGGPAAPAGDAGEADEDDDGTPRRGWWQRTFGA